MNIIHQLLFILVLFCLTLQCSGRSIRTKRQSGAQWQANRARRDLEETFHRLQIIYGRIKSQHTTKYIPTSVESRGRSISGQQAKRIISDVLGPDFPLIFPKDTPPHHRRMAEIMSRNFASNQHPSGANQRPSISVSHPNTSGLAVKIVTEAERLGEGSRRTHSRNMQEVVHLCGQINRELRRKSLRLRCEAFAESDD